MFNPFKKNPVAKLEARYAKLSEEALRLQRQGDILGFGRKTAEAEEVARQIDELKSDGS